MSILSVDNISPIGSGTSVTVNSAATLVLNNANSTGVITATSFVGSGANLSALSIVTDTSPQLGGHLDCNNFYSLLVHTLKSLDCSLMYLLKILK